MNQGTSRSLKRISKELKDIQDNPSHLFTASPVSDSDMFVWSATIQGPEGSVYEGGTFPLSITFPTNYPFCQPRVAFTVNVYHPAINNRDGSTCMECTDPSNWSPARTLRSLLMDLRASMASFDHDPMEYEIARIYKTDRALFESTAREWTRLYASVSVLPSTNR